MKSFQEFRESAQGVPAKELKMKKDTDDEVLGYKPRSKGEEDFKNSHTKTEKDHPVATDAQFKSNLKYHDHKGFDGEAGERKPVKQGSSDVKNDENKTGGSKKSPARSADKSGGEIKPLKRGSSKIKEEVFFSESIVDDLQKIKKLGRTESVSFKDGSSLRVNSKTAGKLIEIRDSLNSFSKKKFDEELQKDRSSFKRLIDFSGKV